MVAVPGCRGGSRASKEALVTVRRLLAIALIFLMTAVAWFALGSSLVIRTGEFDGALRKEVALLWGAPHVQVAPEAWVARPREVTETVVEKDGAGRDTTRQVRRSTVEWAPAPLHQTRADAALDLEHRQKGLLWYDTYTVAFRGSYVFQNPDAEPRDVRVKFSFPAEHAIYDGFTILVNGVAAPRGGDLTREVETMAVLAPNGQLTLDVAYSSRGLDDWRYALASNGVADVRDFLLTVSTNVSDVDFPAGTMSPTTRAAAGSGWALTWQFANLVTGQSIGVDLPERLNPGPLAARITFFAPVSLLFFLAVMVVLDVLSGDSLHPMNYVFISAAFFAFHLLLAYLVDQVSVHVAFVVAAAVSVALVASYLRAIGGLRARVGQAVAAQAVYLIAFSYAFFFEGYTGLAVTIGAVITLFVLMQMTARVRWSEIFSAGLTGTRARHAD